MVGKQRDPERERYWRATMARWRASGLSIRAFCRRQSLTESAFHFWRRELRLREAAGLTRVPEPPTFVPVTVIPTATVAVEVRCPSGHVVTLAAYDVSSLKGLFAALAPGASC
jgi:transposase